MNTGPTNSLAPRSATGYPWATPPPSIEANVPGWRDIVAYKRGRGVKNFEKNALIQVFVSKVGRVGCDVNNMFF